MVDDPAPSSAAMAGGDGAAGTPTAARKRDHLRLALGAEVGFDTLDTELDRWQVRARALPGRDLDEVDLACTMWGRQLSAPLLVSCMTGGVSEAGPINRALAVAAQEHRIAIGLGSGRALLEQPDALATFQVRDVAPDVPVLANVGAAQLATYGPDACQGLVDACEADALVVHLNAVQEAVQPGGDTQFGGVLERIAELCQRLSVAIVVKEVGFGLGPDDVADLVGAGVDAIDVAGAGGTNWARIEGQRDTDAGLVAVAFSDWGWPTGTAVREARRVLDEARSGTALIGSGGVRHGVDALKLLCLGADLVGVARGLLAAAAEGPHEAGRAVGALVHQLRVATWAVGAGRATDLGPQHLRLRGP